MLTELPKRKRKLSRRERKQRRKSSRSSASVSFKNALPIVRVRLMLSAPNVPSRKVSVKPAEKRKKRLSLLEDKPRISIWPAASNSLNARSCLPSRPRPSATSSSVSLRSRKSPNRRSAS